MEKHEDGATAGIEVKSLSNDMLQQPPHIIKEEESSNPGEQKQNERDSVEVKTVQEDYGEENEEQKEEKPKSSLAAATITSKNPSRSATDEESWMEVLAWFFHVSHLCTNQSQSINLLHSLVPE